MKQPSVRNFWTEEIFLLAKKQLFCGDQNASQTLPDGTDPAPRACALIRNQTRDLLIHKTPLQQTNLLQSGQYASIYVGLFSFF